MNSNIFNLDFLMEITMHDTELIRELVTMFLEDSPRLLNNLNHALSENNLSKVTREAHIIKGASGTVGAQSVQNIALQIEYACRENDFQEVRILVFQICQEMEMLKEEIDRSGILRGKETAKIPNDKGHSEC